MATGWMEIKSKSRQRAKETFVRYKRRTYFDGEMITVLNVMSCIRVDVNVCLHLDVKTLTLSIFVFSLFFLSLT